MHPNTVKVDLSRRRMLTLSAGAVGALALGGCSSSTESGGNSSASTKLEKELNVLNWGGYIDFAVAPFEKKYGVKVNIEHYGSETEAFAKVRSSPGRYDTFNVGVGFLEPAVAQGLVQPLDIERIPSYKESYPEFQPGPFEVEGKTYGVAYAWGTNGIAYNGSLVPSPVTSWDSFWDPAFKGKTALRDTAKTQYVASCLYLRLDFNKPSDEQWDKIEEAMIARAKNMRTLWSSGDDLKHFMAQQDVILADCYDGLGVSMHEAQPEVVYATPAEGTPGWYDGPELLARAPHPNAAYAWIDFVTSTAMQLQVAKKVNYAPGNSKVPSLLSDKLLTQLNLKEPETTLSTLKFHNALGAKWDKRISDAWAKAKIQ